MNSKLYKIGDVVQLDARAEKIAQFKVGEIMEYYENWGDRGYILKNDDAHVFFDENIIGKSNSKNL